MWTTAPGRGFRNVMFKSVSLNMPDSKIVNPSMRPGHDNSRRVEIVIIENLTIGEKIHKTMEKQRWYLVSDLVPIFVDEHA